MKLFSKIQQAALNALVIGGHAAISYGVPRSTFDLDFLARKAQREEWRSFMRSLGYTLFHETDPFQQWTPPGSEIAVDLMLVDEGTWAKMDMAARTIQMGDTSFRVVAPAHLIALKLHAMKFRPGEESNKDWSDVVELIKACRLDPGSEELLSIVQRYANELTRSRYNQHFHIHE